MVHGFGHKFPWDMEEVHNFIFSHQIFFMSSDTLNIFPLGIGNVSTELSVEFKPCWICRRKDEYVSMGSSVPAFVMTWDHFFGDSFGTKDVREYLKIIFVWMENYLTFQKYFVIIT